MAALIIPMQAGDEELMREALKLAVEAETPFGAVIARDGKIVARGANASQQAKDPTAHGEMEAIRNCLAEHGQDALKHATLYTTGEPCIMCMGAIVWSGITRVVYAASIAEIGVHMAQVMISCSEIAEKASFADIEITGGVLADDALKLFHPKG